MLPVSRTQVFPLGAGLRFEGCRKRGISECQNSELAVHICGKDSASFCNRFMSFCISCCSVFSCFLQVGTACHLKSKVLKGFKANVLPVTSVTCLLHAAMLRCLLYVFICVSDLSRLQQVREPQPPQPQVESSLSRTLMQFAGFYFLNDLNMSCCLVFSILCIEFTSCYHCLGSLCPFKRRALQSWENISSHLTFSGIW